MPWQETSPMDFWSQFVREFASGSFTMTELAEAYRIAPKTGYKWVNRHAKGGMLALADWSRRARASARDAGARDASARGGTAPASDVGGAQIDCLARAPGSRHRVARELDGLALLQQAGLVRARRARRPRVARDPRLSVPVAPNDLWTVDYKGEFRTGEAVWCDPLTLRDGASRYVFASMR